MIGPGLDDRLALLLPSPPLSHSRVSAVSVYVSQRALSPPDAQASPPVCARSDTCFPSMGLPLPNPASQAGRDTGAPAGHLLPQQAPRLR